MDIQAAGINGCYTYQLPLEQGPGLISPSCGPNARIEDTDAGQALPLSDSEEQVDPNTRPQEDETAQEQEKTTEPDAASELTQEEKLLVEELSKVDAEVRAHEMAHIAAGGELITSGATFSYQQGPDGKNYAVGGEVSIDTSAEPGDPEATLIKMRRVRAAALAPADPSSQDLKVASNAASQAAKAMAEITQLYAEEQATQMEDTVSGYTRQQICDAYAKSDSMAGQDSPDTQTQNSLHIAV